MNIVISCSKDDIRNRLENSLRAEDLDITWLHAAEQVAEKLSAADCALAILVFSEEETDGTFQITLDLKKQHPKVNVILLPAESDSALEFAVENTIRMLRMKEPSDGVSGPPAGHMSHVDEVDELVRQLKQRLGPEAAEYIEEIEGVGYRFKPGAARILFMEEPLWPQ